MSVIIKDMEMPKTCSQCEIWSKCWDERPFWFERLEYCPLMEMADRKTEPMETVNYCKICNHKGCENCVADGSNPYCVPSHYEPKDEPQTERSSDDSQNAISASHMLRTVEDGDE